MKTSGIGGQAVIEGIMMRSGDKYAIAVRKPDKEIALSVKDSRLLTEKYKWLNFPVIRGIFNFVDSLVTGVSTITYSASFYDDPTEQKKTKVDEIGKAVFKDKLESVLMAVTVIISVALAVGLFMVLPYLISRMLANFVTSQFLLNFIEGIVRLIIFILYLFAISRMNDIKRTFMYHGAEHKCINCIEHGAPLTADNVMNSSRMHKRCGTSFMFLVMFISIVFFIFIRVDNTALQLVIRILLIPVIAGVSYEVLRWAGRNDNKFVNAISKPGMWMQKLTTKEPERDMVEVAIAAVEAVFDWRAFLDEYYADIEGEEAKAAAIADAEKALAESREAAEYNRDSKEPELIFDNTDLYSKEPKIFKSNSDSEINGNQEESADNTGGEQGLSQEGGALADAASGEGGYSAGENAGVGAEGFSDNKDLLNQDTDILAENENGFDISDENDDEDDVLSGFEFEDEPEEDFGNMSPEETGEHNDSSNFEDDNKASSDTLGFEFEEDDGSQQVFADDVPIFKQRDTD